MRQPITSNRKKPRCGGPLVSSTFNEHLDEIYYDLFYLYKYINDDKDELERAIRFLKTEIAALSRRISNDTDKYTVQARDMTTAYPNLAQDAIDTSFRANIDQTANVVTLPLKGNAVPKTFVYNLYQTETSVAPGTKVMISTDSDNAEIVSDDELDLINPNKLFWQYVIYDPLFSKRDYRDVFFNIELSPEVLTDFRANTIVFIPHPLYTLTIDNFSYCFNEGWKPLPGFVKQEEIAACRWCFPPVTAKGFSFSLRQPFITDEDSRSVFVFGRQQFGIYYQEYEPKGTVLSPIDIPYACTINKVKHYFSNSNCLSVPSSDGWYDKPMPFFGFELYREESDKTLTYLSNWRNIPAGKIWVKTSLLKDDNGGTPALSRIQLDVV